MEDMTTCTYLKYKQKNCKPSHQSLFLFVTSVARTNFEIELVQRGGSLCDSPPTTIPLTPKRDCIGTLASLDALIYQSIFHLVLPFIFSYASSTFITLIYRFVRTNCNQKDTCIFLSVALLHVLAMHARVLVTWPVHHVWQQLAIPLIEEPTSSFALTPREREVPLLLRDPTAMLIQFILLLPLHLDQSMRTFQHYISNNLDFTFTLTLRHFLTN